MKGATHTTLKIGAIVKDTCAFVGGCDVTSVFFFSEPFIVFAPLEILPMLRGQSFDRFFNRGKIFFVDEVRTMTAATLMKLGSRIIKNTLTSVASWRATASMP